eukprot:gnl/TRDRNA2_/TRDRNA2_128905_c0_seq1.p1 gnl/TRDRNA2_/TRDRNA2_128905_c0~~gnl/TRDRNA2_/TRDRNA2_128905_c0_seq1.p1  ORF type:complete len:413 (-),score=61.11 gnl/TRDRNA2_/TRDRNA2_128905_c0_seq1:50-1288(-)
MKSEKGAKKEAKKEAQKVAKKSGAVKNGNEWYAPIGATMTVTVIFGLGYAISASGMFELEGEGKLSLWLRVPFFFIAQGVAPHFFVVILLKLGKALIGETRGLSWEPTQGSKSQHDATIPWPQESLLSSELKDFASKTGQPFCLNHVTGRQRCHDMVVRIGMSLGSTFTVWFMCTFMDRRTLSSIGMTLDRPFFADALFGMAVGVFIVAVMFAVELHAGWLQFLQFFEVFDRRESFIRCIFYDVVFHLNVALNEELPMRGWILYNIAQALGQSWGLTPVMAFLGSMLVQSGFFVVMHLPSPGGTEMRSMANIFVGGMAGGLNVLLTGGRLGFALGWHFGWNISMGNVFGLSTSGIPISATFVAVAPHPEKVHLHGGVFGPEGGVVAPAAYGLGIVLLALLYGLPDSHALPPL